MRENTFWVFFICISFEFWIHILKNLYDLCFHVFTYLFVDRMCVCIDTVCMYLYIQSFQMFLLALKKIDLTFFMVHHHFPLWVLPLVSCLISSFSEILYFTGILVILVPVFLGWMHQRARHSFTYLCILNTHWSAECLETY